MPDADEPRAAQTWGVNQSTQKEIPTDTVRRSSWIGVGAVTLLLAATLALPGYGTPAAASGTVVSSGALVTTATGQWSASASSGGTSTPAASSQSPVSGLVADAIDSVEVALRNRSELEDAIDDQSTAKSTKLKLGSSST
jgi:predicted anti-sigma-YlaC factor YlaD